MDDDLNNVIPLSGMEHLHQVLDALLPAPESPDDPEEPDLTRAAPVPDAALYPPCLASLVEASTRHNEAVPVAVAINILVRFAALIGPMVYLQIGDERRWLNEFVLLVGPSGLGKGASNHGPRRIFKTVEERLALALEYQFQAGKSKGLRDYPCLKVHNGGLSSGEGLAAALDDGEGEGKVSVTDKRVLVFEPEFANCMSMAQRAGNILMMVLRNAYDGVSIEPLTKRDKVRVTDPYVCLMAHTTARELTQHDQFELLANNGLLNRFLILWQQPVKEVAFPDPMPQATVDGLSQDLAERVLFARQNSHETHYKKVRAMALPLTLSEDARALWSHEYGRLLNRPDCEQVRVLTRRHRLHALILAGLLALLDRRTEIRAGDIQSALAWCDYSRQSVVYIFNATRDQLNTEKLHALSRKVLHAIAVLNFKHQQCTCTDLYHWFHRKIKRQNLHGALEMLLNHVPPLITQSRVVRGPGRPLLLYGLSEKSHHLMDSLKEVPR